MVWLKRHSVYVLLMLLVTHTAAFTVTRVLLQSEKTQVGSVCTSSRVKMLSNTLYVCEASVTDCVNLNIHR